MHGEIVQLIKRFGVPMLTRTSVRFALPGKQDKFFHICILILNLRLVFTFRSKKCFSAS